jgi:hypothetical protein
MAARSWVNSHQSAPYFHIIKNTKKIGHPPSTRRERVDCFDILIYNAWCCSARAIKNPICPKPKSIIIFSVQKREGTSYYIEILIKLLGTRHAWLSFFVTKTKIYFSQARCVDEKSAESSTPAQEIYFVEIVPERVRDYEMCSARKRGWWWALSVRCAVHGVDLGLRFIDVFIWYSASIWLQIEGRVSNW